MKKQISGISLFTLWFGAAVSLAEMMTGSLIAPFGLRNGIVVILLGHLVGGLFLSLAGYIGFRERKSTLESSRFSLGVRGSYIISILNIVQLIGWTAIMLIQAAKAMQPLSLSIMGYESFKLSVIFLGFLVFFWSLKMEKGSHKLNELSVFLLMILSLTMAYLSFGPHQVQVIPSSISLGLAFELSIVMPLSWTPLIADYTQQVRSAKGSFWGSFLGYFIGSSLMYFIGLSSSLYSGSTDPIQMMTSLNLGVAVLLIVVLSTVTTTFMDVYSAVLSTVNIFKNMSRFWLIFIFSGLGTVLALYFPMNQYEKFLYMIGSVFAPTFTIIFMDYFLFKKDRSQKMYNKSGISSIGAGVFFYHWIQNLDFIIGATLPTIFATAILYCLLRFLDE